MKAWLKGGIVGIIIFVILLALAAIFPRGDMGNIFEWILMSLVVGPLIVLARVLFSIETGPSLANFYVSMVIYFFCWHYNWLDNWKNKI